MGGDLTIIDDSEKALPRDGQTQNELLGCGQFILSVGFDSTPRKTLQDGWFDRRCGRTGPRWVSDHSGPLQRHHQIGGEWISSVDLESIVLARPKLMDAAGIGARHPKRDERPVLIAVKKAGEVASINDGTGQFRWQNYQPADPDTVVFVGVLPRNATGRVLKRDLRDTIKNILMQ